MQNSPSPLRRSPTPRASSLQRPRLRALLMYRHKNVVKAPTLIIAFTADTLCPLSQMTPPLSIPDSLRLRTLAVSVRGDKYRLLPSNDALYTGVPSLETAGLATPPLLEDSGGDSACAPCLETAHVCSPNTTCRWAVIISYPHTNTNLRLPRIAPCFAFNDPAALSDLDDVDCSRCNRCMGPPLVFRALSFLD
jgi:hypothetical protein